MNETNFNQSKIESFDLLCLKCSEDLYKCSYCNGLFCYQKFIDDHEENCLFLKEKAENKQCEFCHIFLYMDEIPRHLNICSEKEKISKLCRFCNNSFLNTHIKEHEKNCETIENELNLLKEKVLCEICNESIPLHHLEIHEQICLKIQRLSSELDREMKNKIDYPQDWVFYHPDFKTEFCKMPIDINSENYKNYDFYEQLLQNDLLKIKINKIWRLQNQELWQKYYFEKIKLTKEKGFPCNESWLFYGSNEHHHNYFKLGFDIALSSINGNVGKAIYFYKNFKLVLKKNVFSTKDGKKYIYICKVLTGIPYVEKYHQIHRKPPFFNNEKLIYYDSITNINEILVKEIDVNYFYDQFFAIYDNNRAYPLYLVEIIEDEK